jgi:type II secretory pathway pseudopilin PulG
MNINKQIKAFTLVEVLLYLALTSIVMLILVGFMTVLYQSGERARTVTELDSVAQTMMQEIIQTVRNAEGINAPAAGMSASTLNLNVFTASLDPTVYSLSGSNLTVTEGAGGAVNLNSESVVVNSVSFQNLSRPGTSGIVRIVLTLTFFNPDNQPVYDFTRTYYGSAALKP